MFPLTGIPPLAGFLGKFNLFAAADAAQQCLYWLVLLGAVNATISLNYYLVVVKGMYIVKPGQNQAKIKTTGISWAGRTVLVVTTAAMLLLGILPEFVRWAESAAHAGF